MRYHRNPRQKLPKSPSTNNPGPRRKRGATRRQLDPRAASAPRVLADALADLDPRAAMRFIEALSAFVTFAAKERKAKARRKR